jgi:hypothetical protein
MIHCYDNLKFRNFRGFISLLHYIINNKIFTITLFLYVCTEEFFRFNMFTYSSIYSKAEITSTIYNTTRITIFLSYLKFLLFGFSYTVCQSSCNISAYNTFAIFGVNVT